jgi:signal transduction histidine kinase
LITAASVILSFYSPLREASSILLFVPLIWGFLILSLRGILALTLLVSIARVGVEVGRTWSQTGDANLTRAATEPILPILLYIALAITFVVYRLRQAKLTERLVDIRAKEQVVQVADGLAHDFNNVLTAIIGLAELLGRESPAGEQAREDVQSILDSAHQGKSIVRRLRTFTDGGLYEFAPCELSAVVAHLLPLIRRVLPASVAIETDYADRPLPVSLDSDQFHRLLLNLCLNAATAMNSHGTVRLATRWVNGLAHLTISDTGPGIPSRDLDRIFDPTFTTRRGLGGSGMGLSIAKRIAEDHRGSIQCSSEFGQGAVFDVALPCRSVPEHSSPAAEQDDAAASVRPKR